MSLIKKAVPNKEALTLRQTSGGLMVCKLHYAADGFKNPANRIGKEWLLEALRGYNGGMESPRWLKEMEIKYGAGAGDKIFPKWQDWLRDSNIFIDGEVDLTGAKLYGSYDHGYASPAAYLVHAIYPDGLKQTLWEFYATGVTVPDIAAIINGKRTQLPDGRIFDGNPYAGREVFRIADPEIMRNTQVMNQGPNKSVSYLFAQAEQKVFFIPGTKGDDGTVANWLSGNLWVDPNQPGYQIHRRCVNLIWELGMLQRKSLTQLQQRSKNQPETLLDKDNHAWDALKYWLKRFPVGTTPPVSKPKEADFEFWKNAAKRPRLKNSYIRNFAR